MKEIVPDEPGEEQKEKNRDGLDVSDDEDDGTGEGEDADDQKVCKYPYYWCPVAQTTQ